ncbi:hypothetical protein FRB93_002471 [Tulasnella sp. JGI-2019a]|nr:hypothetical protein FRB93_002471 [Tulasnella sp. JGI-2019a]
MILDPHFKDGLFRTNKELFTFSWEKGCHNSLLHILEMDYSSPMIDLAIQTPPACKADCSALSSNLAFTCAMENTLSVNMNAETPISTPMEELHWYLREPQVPITSSPLL